MRLHARTATLRAAWQAATSAVPAKTAKEIYKSILLTSDGTETRLLGSDGEVAVSATIDGETEPGEIILPLIIGTIFREINDEHITIEAANQRLEIRTASAKFRVNCGEADTYPPVSFEHTGTPKNIIGSMLSRAIDATAYACDLGSTRFALGGICIDADCVIATDGRRLAMHHIGEAISERMLLIPLRACNILRRAIAPDALAEFSHDEKSIVIATPEVSVRCQLMEGRFPKWQAVLPETANIIATFQAGDLLRASRQAGLATDAESTSLDMVFTSGGVRLSASGATSEASVSVIGEVAGDDVTVRVSHDYLTQALASMREGEPVTVNLVDKESAITIRQGSTTAVIMPLSV